MAGEYAVVGGGIVGASVAYHLSERTDAQVTLYERGTVGGETTDASVATVGRGGDPEMARMKADAIELYNEFMSDPVGDPGYHPVGSVSVATTGEGAATLADRGGADDESSDRPPWPTAYYDGESVASALLCPTLSTGPVTGLFHEPAKGYVLSRELAREFASRASANGATVSEHSRVEDVLVDEGGVTGLVVDGQRQPADAVVCAAGPWNVELAGRAGVDLPVRHSPAPILELAPPDQLSHPIPYTLHHESGVYVRSTPRETVLVGHYGDRTDSFDTIDRLDPDDIGPSVPASFRARAEEVLETLFPPLADAEEVGERTAVGSRTPDAWPVLGWTAVEGLSVAAFHSQGIQLAPAAGRIVARQLVDGDPTEFYERVSVSRFEGHTDWRDA